MRMLFEIDKKDYVNNGSVFRRPSARGIIIIDGKVALIHSNKYDYYKFPGGGIEADECMEDALVREILEETGLTVIKNSIREYGQVRRISKGTKEDIFMQDNYYFFCDVKEDMVKQNLDEYEADEGFVLEFMSPQIAMNINKKNISDDLSRNVMIERDTKVLELLVQEGYL